MGEEGHELSAVDKGSPSMAVDYAAIDAEIEALKKTLPKSRGTVRPFTEADKRKLLALWPDYSKKDVARALGRGEDVCRKMFQELIRSNP